MSEIENLASRRAEKSGDCRDWSVLDALREALREVESGTLKPDMVFIAFREMHKNNKSRYPSKCAGGTKLELLGLLSSHLHFTNEE